MLCPFLMPPRGPCVSPVDPGRAKGDPLPVQIDFEMGQMRLAHRCPRNLVGTAVEPAFASRDWVKSLTAWGHNCEMSPEIGSANGIFVKINGEIIAAAAPSRHGDGAAMTLHQAF